MNSFLLVAIGGGIGSVIRFSISLILRTAAANFPWPTLIVNIVGCLLIGLVSKATPESWAHSQALKLFLVTGILGGFTTFSAFGYETAELIKDGRITAASIYVILSVIGGILALIFASRVPIFTK